MRLPVLSIEPQDPAAAFWATVAGDVLTFLAIVVAVVTVFIAYRALKSQLRDARASVEAQTHLALMDRADRIGISRTMDFLRANMSNSPELEQSPGESDRDYHDRLTRLFDANRPASPEDVARYADFKRKTPSDEQYSIRQLVDLLNDVNHMNRAHYLNPHHWMRNYYLQHSDAPAS
jgi:hypothetical protein